MGSVIRLLAIVASGIVLLGFVFFATDELSRGSQNQQNKLDKEVTGAIEAAPIAPTPDEEAEREKANGELREAVDDANDVLLGPFDGRRRVGRPLGHPRSTGAARRSSCTAWASGRSRTCCPSSERTRATGAPPANL